MSFRGSQLTEVLLTIDNIARKFNKEKQQIAIKLHRQFGHPKSLCLIDLVKSTGTSDNEFLDLLKNFDESSEICKRYKKPKLRLFFFFFAILFHFLQIVLQFFKLNIYLIKSSENTHIWLQFIAKILLWNFR